VIVMYVIVVNCCSWWSRCDYFV